jgi:hypothetical protein
LVGVDITITNDNKIKECHFKLALKNPENDPFGVDLAGM